MVRSIFLITEYGGEYEDSWQNVREFGFLTYKEAERQLTEAGWKKKTSSGWLTYENPLWKEWSSNSFTPSFADINEHKFYDKGVKTT